MLTLVISFTFFKFKSNHIQLLLVYYFVGYISTIYFCDKAKGTTHRSNYKQ